MSQVLEAEESGIKVRIDRLSGLADSVGRLEEQKENIDAKREKREQKNQAFNEVCEVISDTESAFNILHRAVELADVLDASVPRRDIEQTLDKYRPRLSEFESKSYDDFADVNEISSTRKEFESFQDALGEHKETIKNNLTATADAELSDVETREAILRIPDVGTPADTEAVNIYKQTVASVKRGQIIEASEFEEAARQYSEVDIDIETICSNYGLSEDAGALLLRFLQNENITLADIDDGVLDELKKLEEFSERLTIHF